MTQAFEIPRSVSRNVVRDLVLSASTGALDAYAVGGFEPEFVADFSGSLNSGTEYYRSGGADTTFSSVFTHTKGDDKPFTMTDSDGVLKWGAHNQFTYSEQFDNAAWLKSSTSITANDAVAPDGTSTADLSTAVSSATSGVRGLATWVSGATYTVAIYAKYGTSQFLQIGFPSNFAGSSKRANFDIQNGSLGTVDSDVTATITSSSNGYYLCKATLTATNSTTDRINITHQDSSSAAYFATSGATTLHLWGAHFYRSDLGGMVNNPDRGDSYVPTTTAAKFLPRRNHYLYNGSTYDNAGILIESTAATNLATYSNDFTNASWSNQGSTDAASSVNGPDGNLATTLTATNTNSRHLIQQGPITVVAGAVTVSAYLKYNNNQWVSVGTYEGSYIGANFDLINNVPGSATAGVTARMENVGGGWYRCSITYTHTTTTAYAAVHLMDSDRTTFTGNWLAAGTEKVEIFGLQVEQGSVPTSYIPTTTTVTRAAETLTVAGANLPYSATAMSFHITGRATYAITVGGQNSGELIYWQVNSTNYVNDFFRQDDSPLISGRFQFSQRETTSGLDQVTFDGITPGINRLYNVASRHGSTFVNGAVSGTALTEDTTPTALPDLSAQDMLLARTYVGSVALFRMWGTDIGDSGIETAST